MKLNIGEFLKFLTARPSAGAALLSATPQAGGGFAHAHRSRQHKPNRRAALKRARRRAHYRRMRGRR